MTNELSVEEAVELLKEKRIEINYQVNGTTQFSRALDMAIKALEQQPTVEMAEDCISREEAIRIAEQGQIQGYEWQFKQLCSLPSVTPTLDADISEVKEYYETLREKRKLTHEEKVDLVEYAFEIRQQQDNETIRLLQEISSKLDKNKFKAESEDRYEV